MSESAAEIVSFRDLGLPASLLSALEAVGYETPSPIQAMTIPHLMQGLDLLGNAPTGTGKTAAFALPLLARLDLASHQVQVMVLAPTRELAIQVAEAFQKYAVDLPGFRVLPVYGGQDYAGQIRQLARGVHVVVGTPGRVMDHMRKGTLRLDGLKALVLDEADEMLRMGFIDDVDWILEQLPTERQMALFSATMPREIGVIARKHLRDPQVITIASKTATAETIRQRYWLVSGLHKLDALTRILEVEEFDGLLIFVRTKIATIELAEKLEARGFAAAALNGDMPQKQRELMVERLKQGALDILIATDVAARGLDVERISLVINYDVPYDTESYIHRIGRTGRAGRTGDAILFVTPRERRMLSAIERATRQKISVLELPTTEMVNNKRIGAFKQSISDTLAAGELSFMQNLIEQYQQEHDVPALEMAAALAKMVIGDRPLLMKPERESASEAPSRSAFNRDDRPDRRPDKRAPRSADKDLAPSETPHEPLEPRPRKPMTAPDAGMERFRIEVGLQHGVKPGNIMGAIANEAGLDAQHIGRIEIFEDHSWVDLPTGMPRSVFQELKGVWVCKQRLNISRLGQGAGDGVEGEPPGKGKAKTTKPFRKGVDKAGKPHKAGKASADKPVRKPAKKPGKDFPI